MELYGMDWIVLAQDEDYWRALVNTVMKFRIPSNVWKFLSSCTTDSLIKRVISMNLVMDSIFCT
jgi:hypothetical protein